MNRIPIVVLSLMILSLGSCTVTKYKAGKGYLMYSPDLPKYEVIRQFQVILDEQKMFFGAIKLNNPSSELGEFLAQEVVNSEGDAAIILDMEYQNDEMGLLFSIFRIGFIYNSKNVIINGQVIKYL